MLDRAAFPSWARLEQVSPEVLAEDSAHPEELATLSAAAVAKRRNEFAMGRIAARRALHSLGEQTGPVLTAEDRSPRWPQGVVGSITHCAEYAAAVVASERHCLALGVDVEPLRSLSPDIARHIADAEEQAWIGDDLSRALAVFSAKEAVFKAFYRFERTYFGFDAVHLIKVEHGFDAKLLRPLGPFAAGYEFRIQAGASQNRVWSAVCLAADSSPD